MHSPLALFCSAHVFMIHGRSETVGPRLLPFHWQQPRGCMQLSARIAPLAGKKVTLTLTR